MDECEYCGAVAELDVISDGDYLKVCRKCVDLDRMVVVQKPSNVQIDQSYKRRSVKEILTGMSGVSRTPGNTIQTPSLSTLRKPKDTNAMKDRLSVLSGPAPVKKDDKKPELQPADTTEVKANRQDIEQEEFLDM